MLHSMESESFPLAVLFVLDLLITSGSINPNIQRYLWCIRVFVSCSEVYGIKSSALIALADKSLCQFYIQNSPRIRSGVCRHIRIPVCRQSKITEVDISISALMIGTLLSIYSANMVFSDGSGEGREINALSEWIVRDT